MVRHDVEKWDVEKWFRMFKRIYGENNVKYTHQDVCYRLLEEVGELVYPIKLMDIDEIGWQLPDIFAWLCAFIYITPGENKLSPILLNKFSEGCPGCNKQKNCTCDDIIIAISSEKSANLIKKDPNLFDVKKPYNLDEWQTFFNNLYGKKNAITDPMILLGRLIEDIGKIARKVRMKDNFENIKSSIASSFAWLFGICNRYSYSTNNFNTFRLSHITYEKYSDTCAKCHSRKCECPSSISRIFISFSEDVNPEKEIIKNRIEKNNYDVISFPDFEGVWVPDGIMNKAFQLINTCDSIVVILGTKFSPKVYAEYLEAYYKLDKRNIFICVSDDSEKDSQLVEFINEIKKKHICFNYNNESDLAEDVLAKIEESIKNFNEMNQD